jgi:hypothetical protein
MIVPARHIRAPGGMGIGSQAEQVGHRPPTSPRRQLAKTLRQLAYTLHPLPSTSGPTGVHPPPNGQNEWANWQSQLYISTYGPKDLYICHDHHHPCIHLHLVHLSTDHHLLLLLLLPTPPSPTGHRPPPPTTHTPVANWPRLIHRPRPCRQLAKTLRPLASTSGPTGNISTYGPKDIHISS